VNVFFFELEKKTIITITIISKHKIINFIILRPDEVFIFKYLGV